MPILITRIPGNDDIPLPTTVHHGDAGLDLRSRIDATITSGARIAIPTGVRMQIPAGHVGLVCPRSGMAIDRGITVLNAPGIIDPTYTGEVVVLLINHGGLPVSIKRGARIAQLVVVEFTTKLMEVSAIEMSERGERGFGSTGVA